MRYYVIGDSDTVLGFALAGVDGTSVETPEEAQKAFDDVIAGEAGIVMITEDVADMVRSRVDKYVLGEQFPLFLEIPGPGGHKADRPSVREMVNQAIGMNL
ncbi:MAG: V-type ATP synthase subunit F [Spirochaetia bacterium]